MNALLAGIQTTAEALLAAPPVQLGLMLGGAVLLLFGARIYRWAVVAPGVVGGAALSIWATQAMAAETQAVAALAAMLLGGLLAWRLERLAVALTGAAVLGAVAHTALPVVLPDPVPWWVPLAAAAAGLLVFPPIYRALLPLFTAILGAVAVAWGAGHPDDPLLVIALATMGAVIQVATRRGSRPTKRPSPDPAPTPGDADG